MSLLRQFLAGEYVSLVFRQQNYDTVAVGRNGKSTPYVKQTQYLTQSMVL